MKRDTQLSVVQNYLAAERVLSSKRTDTAWQSEKAAVNDSDKGHKAATSVEGETCQLPGTIRNILVAVDESQASRAALDLAARLAVGLRARVSVVHVVEVNAASATFAMTGIPAQTLATWTRGMLERAMTRVPAGVHGEMIVRQGAAADQILVAVKESHADILVMGRHNRGRLEKLFLGSTAEAVLHQAACPVLTVCQPPQVEAPATCASCDE